VSTEGNGSRAQRAGARETDLPVAVRLQPVQMAVPYPTGPAHPKPSGAGTRRRGTVAVVVAVVAVMALLVVPLVARKPARDRSGRARGITVAAGQLVIVPPVPEPVRRAATADLSDFLRLLYRRAFTTDATPTSPSPSSSSPIDDLMTPSALTALRAQPDVFDVGSGVRVVDGVVRFAGTATAEANRPVQALLEIDFVADATSSGTPVTVEQKGSVLVAQTAQGWRVAGFDLHTVAASVTPSPAPPAPVGS